jgi:UDP-N-acetylmuramyl pentapeptide phosphotransferase/UDP-N-acetylglucosamine-1-phosphate transferase
MAFVLALTLAALFVHGAARGWRWVPVDHPNARSLHNAAVPRCGGLAIWLATGLTAIGALATFPSLAFAVLALTALSYADDLMTLSAGLRLTVHLVVAGLFASLSDLSWPAAVGFVLGLTVAANFTNFMDGANGLVGGIAVLGSLSLAWQIPAGHGSNAVALLYALAGACSGFLVLNWRSGRLFLGDSGSVPLGFLLCAVSVLGAAEGWWSTLFPAFVFAVPLSDALLTLVLRIVRRERFWQAHRSHAYQRLIQFGLPHTRVASLYIVMTALGAGLGKMVAPQPLGIQAWVLAAYWGGLALMYRGVLCMVPRRTSPDLSESTPQSSEVDPSAS